MTYVASCVPYVACRMSDWLPPGSTLIERADASAKSRVHSTRDGDGVGEEEGAADGGGVGIGVGLGVGASVTCE